MSNLAQAWNIYYKHNTITKKVVDKGSDRE